MGDSPKEGAGHGDAQAFHNSPIQSSDPIAPFSNFSSSPSLLSSMNNFFPYASVVLPPLGGIGGHDMGALASTFPGLLSSPAPFVRLLYPPSRSYYNQTTPMPGMMDATNASMATAFNLNPAYFGQLHQLASPSSVPLSSMPVPYQASTTSMSSSNMSSSSSMMSRPMMASNSGMPSGEGDDHGPAPPRRVATSASCDNRLPMPARSPSLSSNVHAPGAFTSALPLRVAPTTEILHHVSFSPLYLRFSSSTWQNRPTRIYLEAPELIVDPEELRKIASAPRHLVLSEQDLKTPLVRLTSSSDKSSPVPVFHYSDKESFFEMQVWHRAGKLGAVRGASPEPALILDAHSNSLLRHSIDIELQKLYCSKTELYCTINCNKGLKVQDLFLVCILRYGPLLLISDRTPFPSAHARKAGLSDSTERQRSTPFDTRRAGGFASAGVSSSAPESHDVPLTSSTERPASPPSFSALRSSLLAHPNGASLTDKLERVLERKIEDLNQLDRTRTVFASWALGVLDHLSLNVFTETLLVPFITEHFLLPFLEDAVATRILSLRCLNDDNPRGVFMVYLSGAERPVLTVLALFRSPSPPDSSSPLTEFKALVNISSSASSSSSSTSSSSTSSSSTSSTSSPIFFIDSSAYRQSTQSPTLLDTITRFEIASGWRRMQLVAPGNNPPIIGFPSIQPT